MNHSWWDVSTYDNTQSRGGAQLSMRTYCHFGDNVQGKMLFDMELTKDIIWSISIDSISQNSGCEYSSSGYPGSVMILTLLSPLLN